MVFSSILFLFQFMPLFFLLYYLAPHRFRNVLLLIASLVFYGWGEPKYIVLILISILVNYITGCLLEHYEGQEGKRKLLLILSIVYNLGMLGFFKYFDFFTGSINQLLSVNLPLVNVGLPLGISFYTFQIMSYTIDVYTGKAKAEHSIIDLGAYLCMFPQLIAGPIVVYTGVSERLKERRTGIGEVEAGLKIFVIGLGSKVLLANNIGSLWEDMNRIGYAELSMPLAWMGIIAYALQIYFDFNGYSLMAVGLGKMLGFEFPQNFNYPYISKSITEFWRRWHITLSSWFRDYLYIPLGGNRRGPVRNFFNLFVVWFVTGLWHGAGWNFIMWGLYFFVFLSLERLFLKKYLDKGRVWPRIYFIIVILISWLLFAITNVDSIAVYLGRMFSFQGGTDWVYYFRNYGIILAIGTVLATPALKRWYEKQKDRPAGVIILLVIFVLAVAYLVDSTYNPFLYFRF